MKRLLLLLPLIIFALLAFVLYSGIGKDPAELPSALIGKAIPAFSLPSVDDPQKMLTQADLKGPALVNVWATWCISCKVEHPVLTALSKRGVTIYGINYKDERESAQKWLKEFHNPYQLDVDDAQGTLGLDLGVYGAPETFLIDGQGVIRHKFVGVIDEQVWQEQLAPLYAELVDEAGK